MAYPSVAGTGAVVPWSSCSQRSRVIGRVATPDTDETRVGASSSRNRFVSRLAAPAMSGALRLRAAAPLCGRSPIGGTELAGEVALVGEAADEGDLGNRLVGGEQLFAGTFQAVLQQPAMGRR